jgi:hypothetical protein
MSSGPGDRPNAVISKLLASDQAVGSRQPNEVTATGEEQAARVVATPLAELALSGTLRAPAEYRARRRGRDPLAE